jgi:choline-sulfatase
MVSTRRTRYRRRVNWNRIVAWVLAMCVLASFACSRSRGTAGEWTKEAPKILLVTLDTTRADHLSAYGYKRQTSPFLESLAARSVRFANTYTVMPTTDPAHTSMLTCQYPRTHGLVQNGYRRANPEGPSLARWLVENGYETASITSRIGLDPKQRRIEGFDYTDAPRLPQKERRAAEVLDLARTWLDGRSGAPWFLWVHFWEPHKPYSPEAGARDRFSQTPVPLLATYEDPVRFLRKREVVDAELIEAAVSLYDAEIWVADRALSALVEAATAAPPAGVEPLLFVLSDHGESLAERQEETRIGFGHGTHINDEVVKVPWLVTWADRLKPAVIQTPVSVVDVAPTLMGLLRPEKTPECEGRSLVASIKSGVEPSPTALILDRRPFRTRPIPGLQRGEMAWIEFPWKLMQLDGGDNVRLYRLDEDPGETANRADHHPDVVATLSQRLVAWKAERPLRRDREKRTPERSAEREALRSLGYID